MNITKENITNLHLKVNISIAPEDYLKKVDDSINNYRKKLSIPGFRKGHVPAGMAKKMVGNEVLAEELNKLIADTLDNYIKEEKLNILGQPMPVRDEQKQVIDIQTPGAYDFRFELGLISEFQIPDLAAKEFYNYNVKVDEVKVNEETEKLLVRYGTTEEINEVKKDAVLSIIFKELNADETEKENGIETTRRISIESFTNEAIKNKITALKKSESLVINLFEAYSNNEELIIHNILDISHDKAHGMSQLFKITVDGIFEVKKAEMNQELFDKIFGEGKIKSETELKEKLAEEIARSYNDMAESRLLADLTNYLIDSAAISFPEDFLKRWILSNNENPISPEQLDKEFEHFTRQLKWDLISDRIFKNGEMKITADDLKNAVKTRMKQQYFNGQMDEAMEQYIDQYAVKMLEDEKNRRSYFNMAMEEKIFEDVKKKANIQPREISYDEFIHQGNHAHHHHH